MSQNTPQKHNTPWIELAQILAQKIPNTKIQPKPRLQQTLLHIYKTPHHNQHTQPYATITITHTQITATSWNAPQPLTTDLNNPQSIPQLQQWLQKINIHTQL